MTIIDSMKAEAAKPASAVHTMSKAAVKAVRESTVKAVREATVLEAAVR